MQFNWFLGFFIYSTQWLRVVYLWYRRRWGWRSQLHLRFELRFYPYLTRSRQCIVFLALRISHLWVYLLRHRRHKQIRSKWTCVFVMEQTHKRIYQGNVWQYLLWQCWDQTCHQTMLVAIYSVLNYYLRWQFNQNMI